MKTLNRYNSNCSLAPDHRPFSNEAGRSMIEIIGVMAIAGIMLAGALKMYQVVKLRQHRIVMVSEIKEIATNARLLYRGRGYSEISTARMIEDGAMKAGKAIDIRPESGGEAFGINLSGVDFKDCAYFGTANIEFAAAVKINGGISDCLKTGDNQIAILVK